MQLLIENITKQYKNKLALDHINLKLENGVYGLVGPNGAGKTTLINIMVNVLTPTKGSISYDGKPMLGHIEAYLDQLGYLPQYPKFYSNFTCDEFLRYICVLKGIHKSLATKKIDEVLVLCNLTKDRSRKIKEFSGGMRQRLGIAQAIMNDPALLILDEPTAGLDPKERIRFRNIISNLSTNRIVILATHIMEDIESIANHVILIQQGTLLGVKETKEMLAEIQGKVWQKEIASTELARYEHMYLISNIAHTENRCTIRYLSNEKQAEACCVEPKLEEVYLYYFEKGDRV